MVEIQASRIKSGFFSFFFSNPKDGHTDMSFKGGKGSTHTLTRSIGLGNDGRAGDNIVVAETKDGYAGHPRPVLGLESQHNLGPDHLIHHVLLVGHLDIGNVVRVDHGIRGCVNNLFRLIPETCCNRGGCPEEVGFWREVVERNEVVDLEHGLAGRVVGREEEERWFFSLFFFFCFVLCRVSKCCDDK